MSDTTLAGLRLNFRQMPKVLTYRDGLKTPKFTVETPLGHYFKMSEICQQIHDNFLQQKFIVK